MKGPWKAAFAVDVSRVKPPKGGTALVRRPPTDKEIREQAAELWEKLNQGVEERQEGYWFRKTAEYLQWNQPLVQTSVDRILKAKQGLLLVSDQGSPNTRLRALLHYSASRFR